MKSEFEKRGLKIVGLSYDNREVLADFAQRKGIDFPLLADSDSSSLAKLGLVNPEGKGMTEGVAFPGILVLNADGVIQETFFEDSYAVRPSAGSVLASLYPETAAVPQLPEGQDYRLTQTGTEGIAGSSWELVVEFPLPPKAHLYAPGNTSYQPLQLTLEPNPFLEFGEAQYPDSQVLELEAIGESVPVFSDHVELKVPLKIALTEDTKKIKAPLDVKVIGVLQYQICTDKTCFLPQQEDVEWKVTIKPLDRNRSPERDRHK